ncbi:hypothetical protein D6D01_10208, partial [Aureobasidium pullulans]
MATASSNNNSAANNNTSTANNSNTNTSTTSPTTFTIAQITHMNFLDTTAHDCTIMCPSKKALKAALIGPTDAELSASGIKIDKRVEDVKERWMEERLRGASKAWS